jgi:hypothetical protein
MQGHLTNASLAGLAGALWPYAARASHVPASLGQRKMAALFFRWPQALSAHSPQVVGHGQSVEGVVATPLSPLGQVDTGQRFPPDNWRSTGFRLVEEPRGPLVEDPRGPDADIVEATNLASAHILQGSVPLLGVSDLRDRHRAPSLAAPILHLLSPEAPGPRDGPSWAGGPHPRRRDAGTCGRQDHTTRPSSACDRFAASRKRSCHGPTSSAAVGRFSGASSSIGMIRFLIGHPSPPWMKKELSSIGSL